MSENRLDNCFLNNKRSIFALEREKINFTLLYFWEKKFKHILDLHAKCDMRVWRNCQFHNWKIQFKNSAQLIHREFPTDECVQIWLKWYTMKIMCSFTIQDLIWLSNGNILWFAFWMNWIISKISLTLIIIKLFEVFMNRNLKWTPLKFF